MYHQKILGGLLWYADEHRKRIQHQGFMSFFLDDGALDITVAMVLAWTSETYCRFSLYWLRPYVAFHETATAGTAGFSVASPWMDLSSAFNIYNWMITLCEHWVSWNACMIVWLHSCQIEFLWHLLFLRATRIFARSSNNLSAFLPIFFVQTSPYGLLNGKFSDISYKASNNWATSEVGAQSAFQ